MKLIFWSYQNPDLHEAFTEYLSDLPYVEVREGDILSEPAEYLVSAANSFGFMDGGLDLLYKRRLGEQVERNARKTVLEQHQGEVMIGQWAMCNTGNKDFPRLLIVPTMRTPQIIRPESPNVYWAMRAICDFEHKIGSVGYGDSRISIPGLGTGVGGVHPYVCAEHIRLALDRFWDKFSQYSPVGFLDARLPGDMRRSIMELQ